jgi:hypothetical protein
VTKNPFQIDRRFVAHTDELLQSAAWRALSPLALKVLDGYEAHILAGQCNGELRVPRAQIMEWILYGSKRGIAVPLKETIVLGFVRATGPRTIRLTYIFNDIPPTNEWRRFKSIEQARAAVDAIPKPDASLELKARIALGEWPKHKRKSTVPPHVNGSQTRR